MDHFCGLGSLIPVFSFVLAWIVLGETLTSSQLIGGTIIILGSIALSFEMNEAWKEIKRDLHVSLSIDVFQMGLVFFREGMVKQDFVIRY